MWRESGCPGLRSGPARGQPPATRHPPLVHSAQAPLVSSAQLASQPTLAGYPPPLEASQAISARSWDEVPRSSAISRWSGLEMLARYGRAVASSGGTCWPVRPCGDGQRVQDGEHQSSLRSRITHQYLLASPSQPTRFTLRITASLACTVSHPPRSRLPTPQAALPAPLPLQPSPPPSSRSPTCRPSPTRPTARA